MAQEALLSLALPSSSAERPSTSRRLTSLPSVAPRIRPRLSTASTTSGSGLFQREAGCSPTVAPEPTADIGWPLVKTSASGPMPTSRYWLQSPSACSAALAAAGLGAARADVAQAGADQPGDAVADRRGAVGVAGGALLDHPLDHRAGEGDAAGLDRLQVAGREQPRAVAAVAGRGGDGVERAVGRPARGAAAGSALGSDGGLAAGESEQVAQRDGGARSAAGDRRRVVLALAGR